MSDYTPTTEKVFSGYALLRAFEANNSDEPQREGMDRMWRSEFDRWLAAHDKEVLEKAVERMYASAADDDDFEFSSLVAAVRGDGE